MGLARARSGSGNRILEEARAGRLANRRGDNNIAMVINVDEAAATPVGTSGASTTATPLTDLGAIVQGDEDQVGRRVDVKSVRVESVTKGGGFFVKMQDRTLFVLPAHHKVSVRAGDTVSLNGVVLQMPSDMEEKLRAPDGANDDIYVYATSVNK